MVASPSRLLLTAAGVVVLWALSAVLLRYSDGLLPGPAIRSVRRGAVRAVAVGAATWLGATLVGATLTVVGYFHGNPDRIPTVCSSPTSRRCWWGSWCGGWW